MSTVTASTRGYTGDHKSWTGEPCSECGKNHPAWVHKPLTPVQAARAAMVKQMRATAYVLGHPKKYDKNRQAASKLLLDQRVAEYDAAVATRDAERLGRLAAKHAREGRS